MSDGSIVEREKGKSKAASCIGGGKQIAVTGAQRRRFKNAFGRLIEIPNHVEWKGRHAKPSLAYERLLPSLAAVKASKSLGFFISDSQTRWWHIGGTFLTPERGKRGKRGFRASS